MGLRDEQADILGGPILQRPESGIFATFSQYHLVFKPVTLFGLGLLVWIVCVRGLEYLKKHRELRYRKAMRRKHGIPDSDCRPFAVAYAAAKRAHREREAHDRKKTTNYVSDHNPPAVDQRPQAQQDARGLRKRFPETSVHIRDYQLPGKHDILYNNRRAEVHSLNFTDRCNSHPDRRMLVPEPSHAQRPSVRRASRRDPIINPGNNEESRKRSFEDESDVEHETIKKSRIDTNELIGGDEQADMHAQYSESPSQRAPLNRRPEGNLVRMNGHEKSDGVDDLRNGEHGPDEAMKGIDEDEVTELEVVARGKKRDRTEAGSTFGGDDEEDIRNGRTSHHRKRRTISRRKIEIPARGQKRDREVESPESESEGVDSEASGKCLQHSSKKKRGKKVVSDEVGEISAEDPRVSKDSLCGGRKIGDRWEADGVQYKVGEKGERLRLTLVKKARNKYHMPQDSQHPDRSAALEIYVETWMTEEQYKQAEVRQELVWQEAPTELSGSKTPGTPDSPMKSGKNLLWDSLKCSPARRPFRQFVPSGASTRINPFVQSQSQPMLGRRVASSSTVASHIADSTTRPGFRGFSKWEKQDREAEAMSRIRAKIEEQKKAQASPPKSTEIRTSATAPELGVKPPSVPTITVTPVPAMAADGKSNVTTFSFAANPNPNDSMKGSTAAASTTTPAFSLPSTSSPAAAAAAAPSTLFPSTASTASTTASLSPFSFGKPPQAPLSTPLTASSIAMPSVFAKGIDAGTPSSSSPSSILGATTQPQPPSTESASKPVSFSFAKPDVSASSPTVVAPFTIKPQATPVFNTTTGPSPSPVTFSFTPAATRSQSPAPPAPASVSPSENAKPTAPLFSFAGASLSSSTAAVPSSSAPSAPKLSFGQPSTASIPVPGSSQSSDTTSHPKLTFKFGQTTAMDGATVAAGADGSRKSTMPASTFGTATGSNELAKSSPFGTTSASGSTTVSPLASATHLFGKPAVADNNSSAPTPHQLPLAPASTPTLISSTTTGTLASGSAPVFSFAGSNSGSKSAEGSKPGPLFGGTAGGNSSAESKSTFTFGVSANGTKPTSTFGTNAESLKPPPAFGSSEGPKPIFAPGSSAEAPKPASAFGGTEGPRPMFTFGDKVMSGSAAGDQTSTPGNTTFGSFSSASPFTLGKKDDAIIHPSASISTLKKPAVSFAFGAPSGTTGSIFGQPSAFATSSGSSQSTFGKPTSATPSAFGFAGSSNSSSTFTFAKPATQNQKQEQ